MVLEQAKGMTKPRTLFEKIWDSHVVDRQEDGTCVLYIDRHLVHDLGGYCSGTIGGGGDQATKNAVTASRLTTARTVSPASKLGIEEGRRISAMRMLNMTNSRPIVPTSRLR